MRQPIEVVNRPGEGEAEGLDEARAARGDPHVLVMGLPNLLTAPPATGSIGWRDLTPVAMLALDPVALWVNAASPHRTVPDLSAAAMAGEVRVGGAGQAGEMVVSAMARATGAGLTFAPLGGGAEAARALAGRRVDAVVGSPAEAMAGRASGQLRPLCAFRGGARTGAAGAVSAAEGGGGAWGWIPACRDAGLAVVYSGFHGVLLPAAVTREQRAFYEGLLRRVGEAPAWREVLQGRMLEPAAPGGEAFSRWLAAEELRHEEWMYAGGTFAQR